MLDKPLILKAGFFCLIFFLVITGCFIYLLQPVSKEAAAAIVKIPPQTGLKEIAEQIYSSELIRSKTAFKIYAVVSGKARRLKPGKYNLSPAMSGLEIVKTLAAGPREIMAAIIPGMTLKEIDDKLSDLGIIEKGNLIGFSNKNGSLEGFLLPDTYYFFPDSTPEKIVGKFLNNFEEKILPLTTNADLLKLLTIASVLEKEMPFNEDRQIAAGILEKRLKMGMPLQVDATIVYAKCSGKFFNCPALEKEDYKIDSPYNTYIHTGLPPTPVSNPSVEAIKAALNPIPSDYWYYLSSPETKKTIFSKTFDEHNQNRIKYLLNK